MAWVGLIVWLVLFAVVLVLFGGISREGWDLSPCVVALVDLHPQLSLGVGTLFPLSGWHSCEALSVRVWVVWTHCGMGCVVVMCWARWAVRKVCGWHRQEGMVARVGRVGRVEVWRRRS